MLTDLPVPELVRQLRARTISSLEVVNAFIERSERVDRALDAVVVPLFEQAQAAARSADQRATGGDELRPMHGVPFTVKECFDVEGTSSTVGVRALGSHVATRDAALVSTLREAGAILLGKTNLPQLMWFNEADNPLFGRTNNPWDLARGPGGSSGGEAAIIAAADRHSASALTAVGVSGRLRTSAASTRSSRRRVASRCAAQPTSV